MLAKKYRIPQDKIAWHMRKGKRINSELLTLIVSPGEPNQDIPLFTFVVSKKIHKSAVVRNRIKRRLRAICYKLIQANVLRKANYLFLAKSDTIATVEFKELVKMVDQLIARQ